MLELSLAIAGVILSAFFSGSEMAFISANPLQIEVWSKQNRRWAKWAFRLIQNPDRFLITVLVGTTLSNIIATTFATAYLINQGWAPWLVLLFITIIILLFGEVLPKTISGEQPNRFMRLTAPLNTLWKFILTPATIPLQWMGRKLAPESTQAPKHRATPLDREDLKILYATQTDRTVLQQEEKELIQQVFDLREPIYKTMTPRTEIAAVPEDADIATVLHEFIESGFSKLPVYREDLDEIIGVVYHYDMFKAPTDLISIIQPVPMVPSSNTTMAVLKELQRLEHGIAIVLDEYGGTAGLVTLEDLYEELFGDFEDEFDAKGADITAMADGALLIEGKSRVEDVNRESTLNIDEGSYETIAGFLTAKIGRIPHTGERLYLPFGLVVIKKASRRRIESVLIYPDRKSESVV